MAAIEFRPTMKKEELLEIAAKNGVQVDDSMTKPEIIGALVAAAAETLAESPQEDAEDGGGAGEDNDTTTAERPAEGKQEAQQGYNLFVYAGPSLPRGRLKENTVFRGTFEDVKTYLSDALEDYPQIEKLIVPADKLAAFSVKVKTPGNIAHKYYSDIVSAMRGNKEV